MSRSELLGKIKMQETIAGCYEEAKNILQQERGKLQQMAQTLLQKEKIDEQEILAILGPRKRIEASYKEADQIMAI